MTAKAFTCRGVTLGTGRPKICVPIVGRTRPEILAQAKALCQLPAELVEWRLDWYKDVQQKAALRDCLSALRELLGDRPLLLTIRTRAEGGEVQLSPEEYQSILLFALESGLVDLVDVELSMGKAVFSALRQACTAAGVGLVASSHDFAKTPEEGELLHRLKTMEDWGADVAKIAVMPREPEDVLRLLSATLQAKKTLQIPVITMSMGQLGVISRLSGSVFGSAMTFGAAEQASAPGQLEATQLLQLLELLQG